MAQGLGILAEQKKKQEEAQRAAEGKPATPPTTTKEPVAVAPIAAKAPKEEPKKPAKPFVYVPIADKTEAEKQALRDEMAAELAVRKKRSGQ